MTVDTTMIEVRGLGKRFVLHNQGGATLPVLHAVSFEAARGECLVLDGASGAGKSTLLRCLYGNYLASEGSIRIRDGGQWMDVVQADARRIQRLRREVIGYVSQFLRAVPRVPALDVVAEPLRRRGLAPSRARERAAGLLARLNVPERLWRLPPATFSGGEQQRVNIARGFAAGHDILLLDEPTASLDAGNRDVVARLIRETAAAGCCIVGVFHDEIVRAAVATRMIDVAPLVPEQGA